MLLLINSSLGLKNGYISHDLPIESKFLAQTNPDARQFSSVLADSIKILSPIKIILFEILFMYMLFARTKVKLDEFL